MGQDLRFALRSILTHPWFSVAVVVTVAMGIGVNTMVFTLVNAVLLKPLAVPHGERIVVLSNSNLLHSDDSMRISYPDFRDYRAQVSSVESMEAASDEQGVLSERGNPPAPFHMERTTAGLFDMLHIRPVLGRGFLSTDDKPGAAPVLLLGYGVWKDRYSGSPSVIGRSVRVNDTQATIIGIMPEGFRFPVGTDLWMPLVPTPGLEKRDSHPLEVWAMLKPGAGLEQASAECNEIASRLARQYPAADKDRGIRVQTFNQRYNGRNIRTVFLLMLAAVGFVLLIACANVANMMLTRALRRQREMSIRAALGASRWRVIREQLTESLILSVLGGALGLGFAALGVHWFDLSTQNVGKPYWIQFTMDLKVFGYFAALCIVSGLLFGMAPAWRSSHVNLIEVMKEGARSMGKHRGGKFAAAMIIFQFALTLVLLTGAGIFVHNLVLILTANQSVPSDQLMTAHIDFPDSRYKDTDSRQHFFDQLLPRLRSLPGVTHVATASNLPGLGSGQRDFEPEHSVADARSSRPRVSIVVQSPGYFGSSSHLMNHGWHFACDVKRVRNWTGSGGLRFMPMDRRTLVPDAGEVALDQLMVESDARLVMVLRATGEASHCPECRGESRRIHSRYRRRLSDLPWEGLPVRIELRVRRFFCNSEDCGQQIFTERLPKTVQRYSRRTCRLSLSLQQITSALGGSAGSRLAKQLGILTSGSTLLRQLRRKLIKPSAQGPRVLGIDDWAWRKGHRYGTILCDLERGKVVDLLPDRSAESTAEWLRAHPGTEIVSRDRASLYAQAATIAAPQAVQVADRWHLLHNLTEAFIGALVPHHRLLSETAQALVKDAKASSSLPTAKADQPNARIQAKQRLNREHRLAKYEAVIDQVRKGVTQHEIARSCDVGIRTIRRWIRAQVFPERRIAKRRSKVDRHREYLEQRWNEGCHNATQLWHELRERGFTGQSPIVRRWVRSHYGSRRHRTWQQTPPSSPQPSSPRQTAWSLLKEPDEGSNYIAELCRRSGEIATCASVAREFVRIIRQRDAAAWPIWKDSARSSLLASFAKHLCHDEAALLAALQQPWSNGPVEGHVHRLKLIKRSMYGRAKFDLLRLRVVNAD